jgi:hypothetical protein
MTLQRREKPTGILHMFSGATRRYILAPLLSTKNTRLTHLNICAHALLKQLAPPVVC